MSEFLAERAVVVLTRVVPEEGLRAGDVGVVLLVHSSRLGVQSGYSDEVTPVTGVTVADIDVGADSVRPAAIGDVRHARAVAAYS